MDMDSAAVFLAGTILYALGLLIVLIAVVVANNILHKFWKSFGWSFIPYWMSETESARFIAPEEVKNQSSTK